MRRDQPFRGLLLALFFMGIGMSLDVALVRANLWLILAAAVIIRLGFVLVRHHPLGA